MGAALGFGAAAATPPCPPPAAAPLPKRDDICCCAACTAAREGTGGWLAEGFATGGGADAPKAGLDAGEGAARFAGERLRSAGRPSSPSSPSELSLL